MTSIAKNPVERLGYVVSFDTLEHLLHREIMLIDIAEALPPSGMLLLSTPCGRRENGLNPGWEHHKIEYSYTYLYNLMRRFFDPALIPDDGTLPELDFWNETVNTGPVRYLLRANPMACLTPRASAPAARRTKFQPASHLSTAALSLPRSTL